MNMQDIRVLKGYCFRWSLASTSVVVHIARCFLTSGGAVLSFQSYISGLLQCEKISEVLRISFQEQQRFSLVVCSKKSKREPSQCQQVQSSTGYKQIE